MDDSQKFNIFILGVAIAAIQFFPMHFHGTQNTVIQRASHWWKNRDSCDLGATLTSGKTNRPISMQVRQLGGRYIVL